MGYSAWGHKESDTTERLRTHTHYLLMLTYYFLLFSVNLPLLEYKLHKGRRFFAVLFTDVAQTPRIMPGIW